MFNGWILAMGTIVEMMRNPELTELYFGTDRPGWALTCTDVHVYYGASCCVACRRFVGNVNVWRCWAQWFGEVHAVERLRGCWEAQPGARVRRQR